MKRITPIPTTNNYNKDDKKKPKEALLCGKIVIGMLTIGLVIILTIRIQKPTSTILSNLVVGNLFANKNVSSEPNHDAHSKAVVTDACANLWRPDKLVGRCFGLKTHTEFTEVKDVAIVQTADQCKAMCCKLDTKCVTWQYWTGDKVCKMGGPVRLGTETADTALWCEPNPPVKWNGSKIKSRKTDGTCDFGDSLTAQCFGLGPERRHASGSQLSAVACASACCANKGCTMWQQLPERGCYYNDDNHEHYCEAYVGTFEGGRKCVKGFCGGKETPSNAT